MMQEGTSGCDVSGRGANGETQQAQYSSLASEPSSRRRYLGPLICEQQEHDSVHGGSLP